MRIELPERFKERMKERLGEEYEAFLASYEKDRVQGLRFNSLKMESGQKDSWETETVPELAKETAPALGVSLKKIPWVKEGYYYEGEGRPGKHPYHEAGLYYIQEPSAMAVVELLDPRPGDCVLDLCAAPGGKSSHIASRLKGQGFLLSNEIHPARAKILSQNMERMGVSNAVVSNEDSGRLSERFPGFFDKIVVDAPCSGEGMFRKDEEARNQWSEEHVKMCSDRQLMILNNAASMLKPGGRMVYSTCTFAPEENEGAVCRFLEENEDFYLEEAKGYEGFDAGKPQWAGISAENPFHLERTFRIMPHKLEGEGHFMAVLRRREDSAAEYSDRKKDTPAYLDRKKNREIFQALETCMKECLTCPQTLLSREEYIMFGEQLYLIPPQMPTLKGLKIVRAGLHIGTLKKNRLEPSHALALSLLPKEACGRVLLPGAGKEVLSYLKGETFPVKEDMLSGKEKGWVLVCADGYSLGWGKISGGILKNHYPRGLRWN